MLNILGEGGETVTRSPEVKFSEALEHFRNCDYMEQHMSHIKPTVRHKGCSSLTHALFGPPRMKKQLYNDRNLVFALALCMFDNDEHMHNYVLQTIYKRLAGTKLDCPRYGNHWEVIGFQGECKLFDFNWVAISVGLPRSLIRSSIAPVLL